MSSRSSIRENRPCELVEGTLVEKPVGYEEAAIASHSHVPEHLCATASSVSPAPTAPSSSSPASSASPTSPLPPGIVSLTASGRDSHPSSGPATDLVVEVLSESNTKPEMKRKLEEVLRSRVRLVWMVDPRKRTARVHATVDQPVLIKEGQSLDGGGGAAGLRPAAGQAVCER